MKSLFVSKTFWLNIIGLLAGISTIFGFDVPQDIQTQLVTAILFFVNLANIGLRTVTDQGVYVVNKSQ